MTPVKMVIQELAGRIRSARLARGWTQQELADRAKIAFATYRQFESAGGGISLERLYRIAVALQMGGEIENLFKRDSMPRSLAELSAPKPRQRGVRRKP